MNAPGLRDEVVRVYERRETNAQGNVGVAYHFLAWWWARADIDTSDKVGAARGTLPTLTRYRVTFADEAVLPEGGVMRLEDGSLVYMRSIVPVRQLQRTEVRGEIVSDEQTRTFTLFEGDDPVGAMVVDDLVTFAQLSPTLSGGPIFSGPIFG